MIPYIAVSLSLLASASTTATPAAEEPTPEIVVTAERIPGSVVTNVPPVVELSAEAIESYGARNITELLGALAPQTGPGRGRGSGGPVVLLNGQRISGFAELRDLPPEAIQRVQVLPEEVALQFGYSADQRVVNFILKDNFKAITAEVEAGAATGGSYRNGELQTTLVTIGKQGRLTLSGQYEGATRLLESDRAIVQRATVLPYTDPGRFRTLLPDSSSLKLNGVLARKLSDRVSATGNLSWQRDTSNALLGLPTASLTVPGGLPYSPANAPIALLRGFDPALTRSTTTDALRAGATVNGSFAKWTWNATGSYDRSVSRTQSDRGIDVAALQARVNAGAFDPFQSTTVSPVAFLQVDTSRTQSDVTNGNFTLSGPLVELPAGAMRTTVKLGFATSRLSGDALRGGVSTATRLKRDEGNGRINVEIPIASADRGVLAALGRLSVNANFGYRRLSDFGSLKSFGYGINWQPTEGLTLLASAIGSDNEPGIGELGNPVIATPLVPVFDFTRGETVAIIRITGGNPALLTEVQRDAKFSISYQPPRLKGLTVGVDYLRNRSTNPVAGFPTLTPEIEAGFAGRAVRDASGRLISIDSRAVNFAATASDVVRVGFTFQKEFGQPPRRGGAGGFGGGRPDGPPRGGAGGFGGGGFGRGFGNGATEGGRWTLALYDNIRLRDQIQIRPGLPVLDLLGGSATGNNGGAPRHSLDLDAGWFNKGLGFRLTGSYASGSVVTGTTSASTLRFGGLATLNVNAFINFDSRKKLVENVPFLKGARVRLRVENVTGAIRDVRDGAGVVPLSYQPGYIDPRGRLINIEFRKRF